jgi:ElaB/YqjD/DUF883 family membrane-anchored ribosome-binding protein
VDRELEVIRDQMEATRASLADKLEALESQVRETVSSTVGDVKEVADTVSGAVTSVTETMNISKRVEEHPWESMGLAVAVGFCAAYLLQPPRHHPTPGVPTPPAPGPEPAKEQETQSLLGQAMESIWDNASSTIQELAIGTLMGVVREMVAAGAPTDWKG